MCVTPSNCLRAFVNQININRYKTKGKREWPQLSSSLWASTRSATCRRPNKTWTLFFFSLLTWRNVKKKKQLFRGKSDLFRSSESSWITLIFFVTRDGDTFVFFVTKNTRERDSRAHLFAGDFPTRSCARARVCALYHASIFSQSAFTHA